MTDDARGPHQPVGATTTEEARGLIAFEELAERRRTGRRLALIAIGVAVAVLTAFCGTGVVVNGERSRQRALWMNFEMARAENDCCWSDNTLGVCAEAIQDLETLYTIQSAPPTRAVRLASWFQQTIGVEPMAWDVPGPDPTEIANVRAQCHAQRAEFAAPDRLDPRVIAASGDSLRMRDAAVQPVGAALASKDPALAMAGILAVSHALQRCRGDAASAAMVPTSGGDLPDGALSNLHGEILCLRRLEPLVALVGTAASTHKAHLMTMAPTEDSIITTAAAWALTSVEEPTGEEDMTVLQALAGAIGRGSLGSTPFLEDAVGRALARWPERSVAKAHSVLKTVQKDPLARLRVLRALARVPAERETACTAIAQFVIDNARAESDGGMWGRQAFTMPPLCESALPRLEAALPVPNQWGSHFIAEQLGKLGMQALPVAARAKQVIPKTNSLAASTLEQAQQEAVDRDYAARVGMSSLVLGHPSATKGVAVPRVVDKPCGGETRYRCVEKVEHTPDSTLLADLFR